MSTRMIRTLALAVGAGALVLSAAAPAMAASVDYPVSAFPAKVSAVQGDTVSLSYTAPGICDTTVWTWSYKVVGQRSGISPTPAVALACNGTTVSVKLTVATPTTKRGKANSVVKLVAAPVAPSTADAVVLTTVVKVNATKGKGPKPS